MRARAWENVDGKRWRAVRQQVLERDGWACVKCGRRGRLEVDHIQPMGNGEFVYDLDALQTLCRSCHISKTAGENRKPLTPAASAWQDMVDELL